MGDSRFRSEYEWEAVGGGSNSVDITASASTEGEVTNGQVESSVSFGLTITIILDEISSIIFGDSMFNAVASAAAGDEPSGSAFGMGGAFNSVFGDLGEFMIDRTFNDVAAGTYILEWEGLEVAGGAERRIPEPASMALFLVGVLGLGLRRKLHIKGLS
ncbi:PEP-CTERM sorting domain-containing protein [Photobacterium sanctipauli]|uniref:PEP-CTERM sorting domain-containing protein n=2 Tax=Photobacterium sanctipauli TaxID=1342794 RepID=A0A2T3P0V5_9GAMM|nr:PEP-CTERM sorting domain-containing protein [Photobacterium sanctipauli]